MTFAEVLKAELAKRCRKNPRYSMRSFARDLQVDPGNLSRILSGKYTPSSKVQARLLLRIGRKPAQVNAFLAAQGSQTPYFQDLEAMHFLSSSEWYYDAILEATRLSHFKPDIRTLAAQLGLSGAKVKTTVDQLVELKLLKIDSEGKWHDLSGNVSTYQNAALTSEARRQKQKQILTKSQEAVDHFDILVRDHSSTLLCIQKKDVPEAKKMIRDFQTQFSKFLERPSAKPTDLYQLQVSFFPIIEDPNPSS